MGDGQCERLNRTLVNMLKTLAEKEKHDWKSHLPKLAHAVNSTKNKTTGFSPHYLMFGREAVLPIDQVFRDVGGSSTENVQSHNKFVRDWERSMKVAHDIARKNIDKSAQYNKQHYDKHAKAAQLQIGDQVLVRNYRQRTGKPKMRSYYEESLFKVVEVRENVPVYKVQNVMKPRDVRVVHRNKLLKVDELPVDTFQEKDVPNKSKTPASRNKTSHQKNEVVSVNHHVEEEHLESDSEEEAILVVERQEMGENWIGEDQAEEEVVDEVYEEEDSIASTTAYEEDSASWGHTSDAVGSDLEHESEHGEEPAVSETEVDVSPVEQSDESDSSSNPSPVLRRTSRRAAPRKIFTYNELGANPVSEAIT